jgi:putative ABC transport system permease protein
LRALPPEPVRLVRRSPEPWDDGRTALIRFALKSLTTRKLRTTLTALAIVLGVAMMSGSYVLTDTIDRAFDAIFVDSYAGTDAVVTGKEAGFSFEGEQAQAPPIPEETLERVRAVDGVEVATGSVTDFRTKLLRPDGEEIDTGGAPSFAFGIDTAPEYDRFNPLNLVEGRWPSGGNEVAVDEGVADDEGLKLGDRIGVAALGPARQFELVGIARYGELRSIGGATFAIFDVPTAQALVDKEGQLDAVQVAAEPGTSPEQLTTRIQAELGPKLTVRTGVEQADEQSDEIATFTTIIRYFLLSFAGIALFVGAFVIFNTLSITVAQRTREFAIVRTLGASRRQVLRSVVLEALVIGFSASVVGLFAGLGLAVGLDAIFRALNLDLPQTDTVFATRTIVVSLLVGTLVTLVAGLIPAVRATRVPPIAAVREGATLPRGRFARFTPYIAGVVVAIAVLALGYGTLADDVALGDRFALLGLGVLALFVGVAMLSSRLVGPLTRVVGIPARRLGGAAGDLADRNAQRNPGRTAATAAALMIGIALVTFVSVLANGIRVSNSDAIERQIQSDLIVTSQDGYSEFPAAAGDAVASAEGVALVSHVRQDIAEIAGGGANLTGLDEQINEVYDLRWEQGSDEVVTRLGADGVVLPNNVAEDKDLTVGDTVTVLSTDNKRREFVVRGIYEGSPFYPLLGSASISHDAFEELYNRPRNRFTLVNADGDTAAARANVERALDEFPDTRIFTRPEWIEKEDEEIQQFLLLLYVLLALSVIISLFGMVNTLALSVFERTRELGMLRAVGMTRRQTRRMIRHESVITALIGAALGLPLGIFLAALVTTALGQYDLRFALPFGQLVVLAIVAVFAGILAAITPARRAAKLDPLRALQYE